MKIQIGARTDLVVYNAKRPVKLEVAEGPASFEGAVGGLSLRGKEVEQAYALEGGWTRGDFSLRSHEPQEFALRAVEGDALILEGPHADAPLAKDVVRLLTRDGWVYPYTVVAAEPVDGGLRVRVAEGPGLTFDRGAGKLRLTAFPQPEHSGAVRVEWMTHASR